MSLATLPTILFFLHQLRSLPFSFVYLSLNKCWALPEQHVAVLRSLLHLNMHNKLAAFKSHALKKKKITSNEKNSTFAIYYKNAGTQSLEQKERGQNKPALCVES